MIMEIPFYLTLYQAFVFSSRRQHTSYWRDWSSDVCSSDLRASFTGTRPPGPSRRIELPSIEPTADGYVGFTTTTAQQFRDFLVLVERPDLLDDPELASADGRAARRDEMTEIIRSWTTARTTAECVEQATLLRIPVAPVGNAATLLEMDHFRARGVFEPSADGEFLQPR